MAAEYKDYYKILDVPRTATEDEIRKAFRKLARKYHPDVAKDKKTAEEKFKEINEAYEVLGDAEKRKKYDSLGANWKSAGGFQPPPGWQAGGRKNRRPGAGEPGEFEFQFDGTTGFSDFFEQIFGSMGGHGWKGNAGADFAQQASRGQDIEADIMVSLEEALNGATRPISLRRNIPCPQCGGDGELNGHPCAACGGNGWTPKQENYTIRIPAGVREGQRLRIPGRGDPGAGGGQTGDLYLNVRLARHPDFRVEESNLYHDLSLAPWEVVLGTQVSVPTLDGRVSIKIPPGSQNGQQLRVRSRGLKRGDGERGDLFVMIHVETPTSIPDDERTFWEQLAKVSKFNPRD